MLSANFCRCKALLKLSERTLNTDLVRKIDSRSLTAKVIFSSDSPHELGHKSENYARQEQTFEILIENESQCGKKYKPKNSNFKSSHQESYKKNYIQRDGCDNVKKNQHKNTVERSKSVEKKRESIPNLFDTRYAFLENTVKVRIKPKSPYQEDDVEQNKIYKRNYKIKDNPAYLNVLNKDEQDEVVELKNDESVCNIPDASTEKPRKRYSFDSELAFKEDADNASPLKLNVDAITINSSTDSSLITSDLRIQTINTTEGPITLSLPDNKIDIDGFLQEFKENIPGPLDECTEDISYFGPGLSPTFNFAAYADHSKLIQQYIKLGVKLFKVEKNMDHMKALLTVDMEKELPVYIQFLHDCGIPANSLGDAITQNPMILKQDLDDMKTRIRYLRAHKFTPESIARIVTKNPSWLVWATKSIDERLGHFQNEFKLGGSEVRYLATKAPKLITYPMRHIYENTFTVKEQMGFNKLEIKLLLLHKPRLWMNNRKKILDSFDYLHNTMKLSHVAIATHANVLETRKSRIKSRHEFLVELKKAQFDPKKPGYIAPRTMVIGSDADFCTNVAKTSVDTYNLFLKTR